MEENKKCNEENKEKLQVKEQMISEVEKNEEIQKFENDLEFENYYAEVKNDKEYLQPMA